MNDGQRSSTNDQENYEVGVLCVLGASLLSGFSTSCLRVAYNPPHCRHALLLSVELAVYGMVLMVVYHFIDRGAVTAPCLSFFHNWSLYTLIPVISNSCGGLAVGLVTKYAGAEAKGFALIGGNSSIANHASFDGPY